ncbi:hypothetical protein CC78DRAFT_170434 [Lojkania enalia]|uniref:Uncharacterized protein n=1 Tax=Lojkania enalia TaxID=147567 RepID=A0A9P4N797_9PLEO|nr:hypothetical protein CC78DRAFT_170434 [Didymosphaeria enalia]
MAAAPPYPLYFRTYYLYRVSPFHHGDSPLLADRALRTHATRLRDQLKGDNVRGVEVDFASTEGALPNLGPLEECHWDLLGDEDAFIERHRQLFEDVEASQISSAVGASQARGIQVTLDYERQSYSALLLRDPEAKVSPAGFTSLPLLLVKMPALIRDIFLNYLRTNFDAHVAPLKLQSIFLTSTLENYFRHLSAPRSRQSIRDVVRQLQVQLAFPGSTTVLKHIDVNIAGADVLGFFKRGKLLPNAKDAPFTTALRSYLQNHLALDISNPKVQISRITCGSFTIQSDRIKILAPDAPDDSASGRSGTPETTASQRAVDDLYTSLVREAAGSGKFLPDNILEEIREETPSSTGSVVRRGRKRAVSNTAPGNTAAKKTQGRGKENGRAVDGDEDTEM